MDGLPIQPYDVAMLAVLVLTTLFGLWKGMAWQLASLGSVVLSCLVAMQFSGPLAPYISDREPWNRFIAMLALYLVTSLAVWLVFRLVAGVIDRVRLKEFDRQLGALFGLAKGCLLCLVITFFAVTLSETVRQAVLKSKSGQYIALAIQKAAPAMPEEIRDVLGKYIEQLDQKLDPDIPPDTPPIQRALTNPPSPAAPVADQPLGDKLKAQIRDHVTDEFDRHVDAAESEVYYVIAGSAGQGGSVWRVHAGGNDTIEAAVRGAGSTPRAIEKVWLVRPALGGAGSDQVLPVQWDPARRTATPNYRIAPGDAVFVGERNSPWTHDLPRWIAAWRQWLRR